MSTGLGTPSPLDVKSCIEIERMLFCLSPSVCLTYHTNKGKSLLWARQYIAVVMGIF